jgi:hypothetical protein
MSIKIMSLVWEHYPTGGGELLTALAYADHAHDDGAGVRPSIAHMARKTRQSERTIQTHVATMRRTTWLLTVCHAGGGRGRATEYRINPMWISNPASFAPFLRPLESVQVEGEKGAANGAKGRKARAPQPPRTVIEPTTTASASAQMAVVVVGLEGPPLEEYRSSILKSLESCPVALHQQIVDEALGAASTGSIRKNAGSYVRGLAANARRGTFVPVAGIAVAAARRRREEEHAQRVAEEAERQARETPEARESARRARDAALAKLGRPAPRPSSVVAGTAVGSDR